MSIPLHPPGTPLVATCHAKVNLHLRIVARRPDGYHDLETLFCSVSLADRLRIEPIAPGDAPPGGVALRLDGPACSPALEAEDSTRNLAVRAYLLARQEINRRHGLPAGATPPGWPAAVRLHLHKRIPVGAGLAGGSADAAGALHAAAAWAGGLLSLDDLTTLAAQLGSDIPFCIRGGLALGRGRGELLTHLAPPAPPELYLLLVHPPFAISTAEAYRSCHPEGPDPEGSLDQFVRKLSTPGVRMDLDLVSGLLHNTFYQWHLPGFGDLEALAQGLVKVGARAVLLSGSGPTLMGFFASRSASLEAQAQLAADGVACQPVEPVPHGVLVQADEA